ncbi:MAG: AsnC family transcriptional regulator [Nanoarchaeota archaeon]|jgi:Lrp/AsnC family leucine-responsive transcriptional regulator|nr:AsnC family transcriptional regulator [Nanoarchaeota archaeon]
MVLKLDLKDKKILSLLDENARLTNSQIASKVELSKPAVEYRLNRFRSNDIIFNYYTVINFTRLGYSQYKIYFKFENASPEDENLIRNYWIKDKSSIWVGEVRGNWDLAVSILAKNNFEFGKTMLGFMNKFSKFILKKDVLLTEYSPMYSREYFTEKKDSEFVYGFPEENYSLDETDEKIIKELSVNARISIVELSEKIKLTRDIINYRVKKLAKEKIIIQYRMFPNLENIGIKLYKVTLRTKSFDEKQEKILKDYVKGNNKITHLLKLVGSWDIELEYEVEDEDGLYKELNKLRKEFSNIIRDFDIMRITQTFKYNYYPF